MPLIALLLAIGLLSVAVGATARDHGRERDALSKDLKGEVREQAQMLEDYLSQARSLTLITANNPAYQDFYAERGSRAAKVEANGATIRKAQDGLAYLNQLFPGSIGKASFIDRDGHENARAIDGRIAPQAELTADEKRASYFRPTFELSPGEVHQARPYLSPETGEWVISNSTPVQGIDGPEPAIVLVEMTIESFRLRTEDFSTRFDTAIVEAKGGRVVADSRFRQLAGKEVALGRPGDKRFVPFSRRSGKREGTGELSGRLSAFVALSRNENNANSWLVVATARETGGSWVSDLGLTEAAMVILAALLFGFALFSFRSSQSQLRAAALTDPLTGLGNRRALEADMSNRMALASADRPLQLVLFDLDGFKSYNDTYGHPAGDALLVRLATALEAATNGRGSAFRMGGDEFCVLAQGQPADHEQLRRDAAEALSERGDGFSITASCGSILLPLETSDASEALRLADQRMYANKSSGRSSAGRQSTDVLLRVLAERHPDIGAHLDDVTLLCSRVADELELPEDQRVSLLQAASLHDIGKAAVPDEILTKPGPLTEAEWIFMRQHTVIGERILAAAPALTQAAKLVRWSHERPDGSGYPDGLIASEIPLGARIIAICDSFDAMTTPRPYRRTPMSFEGGLAELRRCAGAQFDPAVVEAFAAAMARPDASAGAEAPAHVTSS
ncbi:MAG TPA: HD domain-containing phosphohydrolase [Thermoleophilaceae bacterium]|nr:HD domain-containing phosphohydrolase [Thermoleophilaceae bacterium]